MEGSNGRIGNNEWIILKNKNKNGVRSTNDGFTAAYWKRRYQNNTNTDTDTDTDTESKAEGNFLKEENKKEYIDPNQIVDSS